MGQKNCDTSSQAKAVYDGNSDLRKSSNGFRYMVGARLRPALRFHCGTALSGELGQVPAGAVSDITGARS